jgi:hypothetical protein
MLYEILLDTPRSKYDPRQNLEPHSNVSIVSANFKSTELVTSQLKEYYLIHYVGGKSSSMSFTPT